METSTIRSVGFSVAVFALVALLSGASADVETLVHARHVSMVGVNECTYGPAFWCKNITNAAGCKAVKHCIQTTWETQKYPEDNDDICTICKNMVKQARDTLTSNVTLDELKQVFEGSCQLLPLKPVKTECIKLADEFIPELVDTLASEMDPNVVCTVSGLCNSARIDKLLLENNKQKQSDIVDKPHMCEQCAIAMNKGENLVQTLSKEEILNRVMMMCGELSSYSDACNNIVLQYRDNIYNTIKTGFTKHNICMLSGMCSEAFHPHANGYEKSINALMGVEISNAGERGRLQIQKPDETSDELVCEFCEAMVKHLRDILISNTTEEQFLDVLKGLCKQTKSFSKECLEIVNDNYARIYQFLITELNGKKLCSIVGICQSSKTLQQSNTFLPMFPLVLTEYLQQPNSVKEEISKKSGILIDEQPPKYIDHKESVLKSPVIDVFYKKMHVVVNDVDMPKEKTTCFLCQSILHYVQQTITDPTSESEIRDALEESCTVLPSSFAPQCKQFIDQYSEAFISLVAQEIDPSILCAELKVCPAIDVSLTSTKESKSSDNCPLCVIFMSTLEKEISNKDTEAMITTKLEKLCSKMPRKWKTSCKSFVDEQFQEILDLLVAEVKPKEICILLGVCKPETIIESKSESDLETNMVTTSDKVTIVLPNFDMGQLLANNYKMIEKSEEVPTPFCLLCTIVMKYLNSVVKDKSNQASIENALDDVCSILPNVEENECQSFINLHYPQIIKAIQIGTEPTIACMAMMVCLDNNKVNEDHQNPNVQLMSVESVALDTSEECSACEAFVKAFGDHLANISVDVEKFDIAALCDEIDVAHKEQCSEMVQSYAQTFQNLSNEMPSWMMCEEISLCSKNKSVTARQFENSKCLEGIKYWCLSNDNAKECKDDLLSLVGYGCNAYREDRPANRWLVESVVRSAITNCYAKRCAADPTRGFHPKCTICKDVIRDIKHKIENSPMEQDLRYRLEALCDILPMDPKAKCVNFVDTYSNKVINTIIDDVKEESVCAEIGYC